MFRPTSRPWPKPTLLRTAWGGVLMCACWTAQAQPPTVKQPFDLTRELLDGLPQAQPTVQDRPGEAAASREPQSNPQSSVLDAIAGDMRKAERQLRSGRVLAETRALQLRILAQLEQLTKQNQAAGDLASSPTERSPDQDRSRDGSPSRQAVRGSNASEQAAQQAEAPVVRESLQVIWGHLPMREQHRIRSPLHEEFLPSYRQLITEYYKRLAEE